MNDNKEVPNSVLRDYVTDSSFVLTLSRNHINTLVTIAHNDRDHKSRRDFVNPGNGLIRRGLVNHVSHAKKTRTKQVPTGRTNETRPVYRGSYNAELNCYWRLTKAGWLVYDLLVEAGIAPALKHELRHVA
jgi:hypothetical protein